MIRCYLDFETTGVDPYNDLIVQAMLLRQEPGLEDELLSHLINPGIPIPPEATEVHGLGDDDVANEPSFADIASQVERLTRDAVLIGYNSRSFDVPLLHTELRRSGLEGLPVDEYGSISVPEIDLYKVWSEKERRTLTTAAWRFARMVHEDDAHSAEKDTLVLPHVLVGMRGEFDMDFDEMLMVTSPEDEVDRDGKFTRDDEGKIMFGFGKHFGNPVSRNMPYIDWMLGADFSPETKAWCRRFKQWSGG